MLRKKYTAHKHRAQWFITKWTSLNVINVSEGYVCPTLFPRSNYDADVHHQSHFAFWALYKQNQTCIYFCLTSLLNTMFVKFLHTVVCGCSFIFTVVKYPMVQIHHNYVHLLHFNSHFTCSAFLAIAVMPLWILFYMSLKVFLVDTYLGVGLLDHTVWMATRGRCFWSGQNNLFLPGHKHSRGSTSLLKFGHVSTFNPHWLE